MHHGNGYTFEHPELDKPLLLVSKPIVLKRERRPREHFRRVNKVQAVRFQIGLALLFIPLIVHLRSVYTSEGKRKRQNMPANARAQRRRAEAKVENVAYKPSVGVRS